MSLTAKTGTILRNSVSDGNDTLGSGFPRAQVFRGQGNVEPNYEPGGNDVCRVAVGEYDFSKDGATGAAAFLGLGVFVPANCAVIHTIVRVVTQVGGVTNIGFSLLNDNDLLASIASLAAGTFAGDVVGFGIGAHTTLGANVILTGSTKREIVLTTTGATSTAGKISIYVFYVPVVG